MKLKLLTSLTIVTVLLLLTSCQQKERQYVVGVSQCSHDIWREKQNAELRMGAYFNEGVELRFAAAYDSDERQVQQIDSLLSTGIDLLIVAPNQVQTISPAIDRAYDSGIPVIVFERKTNSQKYTSFMSADNYEMGRVMGNYIAKQLKGRGRVLEVMGLSGSSPAIDRHKGFADALSQHPDMEVVATLQGDWTEESAYKALTQWLATPEGRQATEKGIDFVFGQNDRMAMGARHAFSQLLSPTAHRPKYCGIDGLPGKNGGIQLVCDSILDASYIYPTHGDQLLQQAVDILDGKPYEKEVLLQSAIVTRDNAEVLLMQTEEILRQNNHLDCLHKKADSYLQQLDNQRIISLLALGIIVLLVVAIVLFYRYHIGQLTLRRERVVNTLWNMNPEDIVKPEDTARVENDTVQSASPSVREPVEATEPATTEEEPAEKELSASASLFIARFKEVVESHLEDSELSVEDLAAQMNLSRVQLYRKVKAVTGSTPVELLRTARLKRAYQLLLTTDKSISEVAYQVGFTAPSYFTKCFKEEYGQLPGNIR